MTHTVGLYCFTTDLRLHDQPALTKAASEVDQLVCYYQWENAWSQHTRSMNAEIGSARQRFLAQSVADLSLQLNSLQQRLWLSHHNDGNTLGKLIEALGITDVYRSAQAGWFEHQQWHELQTKYPNIRFHSIDTRTLYDQSTLPFAIETMPGGFSGVRGKLEKTEPCAPISTLKHLPSMPESASQLEQWPEISRKIPPKQLATDSPEHNSFKGGERAGLAHLSAYLSSGAASSYKQTRNALDGWSHSCKFSPWLATGSLSVRTVVADLKHYEAKHGANESSYWIYVELLWREYFQWYAMRHGSKLYQHGGANDTTLAYTHDSERIEQWIHGRTDYPLVNACMTELRLTGFMSNRGRQIVASCLVNELEQDWRFGAAYFEQVLIDYDAACNWGNWQYIAGAGPTTVQKRHFNLDKQSSQFDPKQRYTQYWLEQRDAVTR